MAIPERKVRPAARYGAQAAPRSGRNTPKRIMEASEKSGRPPEGDGGTGLHRIDLDRVAETLGSDRQSAGYSRLGVMLNSILPRLVGEPHQNRR
jgi:hypothetical protein